MKQSEREALERDGELPNNPSERIYDKQELSAYRDENRMHVAVWSRSMSAERPLKSAPMATTKLAKKALNQALERAGWGGLFHKRYAELT